MQPRGLLGLGGVRKVDEAVPDVQRGAFENARRQGRGPGRRIQQLVDSPQEVPPPWSRGRNNCSNRAAPDGSIANTAAAAVGKTPINGLCAAGSWPNSDREKSCRPGLWPTMIRLLTGSVAVATVWASCSLDAR